MALPDTDSSVGHSFGLEFDGVEVRDLREVAGLTIEQDVVELKETAPDGTIVVRRLPGRAKAGEVTLTRGLTADRTFDTLVAGARAAAESRRTATVAVFATDGTPVARYHLENAWPSKLEIGGSAAGGLTETLTVAYERVTPG